MKEKILKKLYILLAFFVRNYLGKTSPFIIGITGSVGKTSCRMIVTQVLEQVKNTDEIIYTSPKNFNSEIGLILSVFEIEKFESTICNFFKTTVFVITKSLFCKPKYKTLVLEYGIDHKGDMDFLLTVAVPDVAIFTKLDKVHGAYFENAEQIGDEKFKLMISAKKQVYLNAMDDYCIKNALKIENSTRLYYGGDMYIQNLSLEEKDSKLISVFEISGEKISTNLFGNENLSYIALALLIAKNLGYEIKKNHFEIDLQAGRFSLFKGINNSILIDSTYNAAPESMKVMIKNTYFLRDNFFLDYKIGFVIGDMRELGDNSEAEHKKLSSYLLGADLVYLVGNETQKYVIPELKNNSFAGFLEHDTKSKIIGEKLKNFINSTSDKYIILFKGSQNTIFIEEALKEVLLNESDKKALIRQSTDWLKKK